jgi:putative DNA primase/helicase
VILGDYGYVAPFSLVERSKGESRRDFDIANLQSMRFVMASETREGGVWDKERLKRLSGGDPLHAEIKFGAEFNFLPTHKLWFMFNHQPRVRDHSTGFWRRVRLIPFLRKSEGAAEDKLLDQRLAAEREGILAWLVRACLEWQEFGLPVPQAVQDASKQYEAHEDPLLEFISSRCRRAVPAFTSAMRLALPRLDARRGNQSSAHSRSHRFGDLLEARGFRRTKKANRPYFANGSLHVRPCTCFQTPCACSSGIAP